MWSILRPRSPRAVQQAPVMSSTPLALSLARRAAQLGARAGVAACLVAPALIACGDNRYRNPPYYDWDGTTVVGAFNIDQMAGDDDALAERIRFTRSISGKPKE